MICFSHTFRVINKISFAVRVRKIHYSSLLKVKTIVNNVERLGNTVLASRSWVAGSNTDRVKQVLSGY